MKKIIIPILIIFSYINIISAFAMNNKNVYNFNIPLKVVFKEDTENTLPHGKASVPQDEIKNTEKKTRDKKGKRWWENILPKIPPRGRIRIG